VTIGETFDADAGRDPWAGGYIAPGMPAPVVLRGRDGVRYITPRIWGVPPPQSFTTAANNTPYRPVTTVRNLESPFWIGSLRHTEFRCLIPVTRFQLWSQHSSAITGRKASYWFGVAHEPVFALAGIWRDSEVASFAFLVTQPNHLADGIGAVSMPMILHPEDHNAWLTGDWNTAKGLAEPYPAHFMTCQETSIGYISTN
jgi:putative SOS response-associated peptidase YedK